MRPSVTPVDCPAASVIAGVCRVAERRLLDLLLSRDERFQSVTPSAVGRYPCDIARLDACAVWPVGPPARLKAVMRRWTFPAPTPTRGLGYQPAYLRLMSEAVPRGCRALVAVPTAVEPDTLAEFTRMGSDVTV